MNKLCLNVLFFSVPLFLCSYTLVGVLLYNIYSWNTSVNDWVFDLETGCPGSEEKESDSNGSVCCSPACDSASIGILSILNRSQDPCENFYEYACGNTAGVQLGGNKIQSIPYTMERQVDVMLQQVKMFLEDETKELLSTPYRNAKIFYKSCRKFFDTAQPFEPVRKLLIEVISSQKNFDYFLEVWTRKISCEEIVTAAFPITLASFLYHNRNGDKSHEHIKKLFADTNRKLQNEIINSWMQHTVHISALWRVASIKAKLGYPTDKENKLEDPANSIKMTGNFYDNLLEIFRHEATRRTHSINFQILNGLGLRNSPVILQQKILDPEFLVVPECFFHGFFYHREYPDAINFARSGYVLGHELTHLLKVSEFEKLTENSFDQTESSMRSKCFVNQYSKFPLGGNYVNGTFTLDENISDTEGIKIAYKVFKDRKQNVTLPRINKLYTLDQLFFISYAQNFCVVVQPTDNVDDPHSPFPFRVQGPLVNMPEFSEAFNCPIGSNYNPRQERCGMF